MDEYLRDLEMQIAKLAGRKVNPFNLAVEMLMPPGEELQQDGKNLSGLDVQDTTGSGE